MCDGVTVCPKSILLSAHPVPLQKLMSLQSGGLSLLVYWATLLLTLVTTRYYCTKRKWGLIERGLGLIHRGQRH